MGCSVIQGNQSPWRRDSRLIIYHKPPPPQPSPTHPLYAAILFNRFTLMLYPIYHIHCLPLTSFQSLVVTNHRLSFPSSVHVSCRTLFFTLPFPSTVSVSCCTLPYTASYFPTNVTCNKLPYAASLSRSSLLSYPILYAAFPFRRFILLSYPTLHWLILSPLMSHVITFPTLPPSPIPVSCRTLFFTLPFPFAVSVSCCTLLFTLPFPSTVSVSFHTLPYTASYFNHSCHM